MFSCNPHEQEGRGLAQRPKASNLIDRFYSFYRAPLFSWSQVPTIFRHRHRNDAFASGSTRRWSKGSYKLMAAHHLFTSPLHKVSQDMRLFPNPSTMSGISSDSSKGGCLALPFSLGENQDFPAPSRSYRYVSDLAAPSSCVRTSTQAIRHIQNMKGGLQGSPATCERCCSRDSIPYRHHQTTCPQCQSTHKQVSSLFLG